MNTVFVYIGLKVWVAESKYAENKSEAADSTETVIFYIKKCNLPLIALKSSVCCSGVLIINYLIE